MAVSQSKRARTPVSQHDRARAVTTIRRMASDGLLSSGEADRRLEQAYRASTLGELDLVFAGLPDHPLARAEAVTTHGVPRRERAKKNRPWWWGFLIWWLLSDVFWLIVWVFTGGPFYWVILAVICSTTAFAYRLATRHRRLVLGKPLKRHF